MNFRISFLIVSTSMLFISCYKKQYEAAMSRNVVLQNEQTILITRYDSLSREDSKKELQKDSLRKQNVALEENANDFVHKYMRLPTGAKLSSNAVLESAKKYQPTGLSKSNVLYNPVQLSPWGNLTYGNCVTAEEAFAKACNNPEIFIPEDAAIAWANENGVLNGAYLYDVLGKMKDLGFRVSGTTYNDGSYSLVDFRNSSILQNAISTGPVKIRVTATQLGRAWNYFRRGWFALGFQPEQITNANSHCVSLCGYGTLSWLAQQFNVPLPVGVDGQKLGYALFTWGSIGIIDQQSLLAITHEAWVRNPTTVPKNLISSFILKAKGGEAGSNIYLSHAYRSMDLRTTQGGAFGEMWICHDIGGGKIKLQARGAEGDLAYFLSHAFGNLELRADRGSGEEWIIHNLPNGEIALEASGGEKGKFLSHAFGKLALRGSMQGGEAWQNIGQNH